MSAQVVTPDPGATTFAEVVANGSGCPLGSANTRIATDGLVFTTTFSQYQAQLSRTDDLSVVECVLSIKLHSPAGRSFSVQTFSYSGFAYLGPGVTGRLLASYTFQGQGVQAKAARTDLRGPYDDDFVFRDDVPIEDAVWSPCGVERDLNIVTRILLENQARGQTGFMNLTAADGSSELKVVLNSRKCTKVGEPSEPTKSNPVEPLSRILIGETQELPADDFGANLLTAQDATLTQRAKLMSLHFHITRPSGRVRLGMYDASGPNGSPGNKLAETVELISVRGWNDVPVIAPVTLSPGKYWLAFLLSSPELHFNRDPEPTSQSFYYSYPYGPLPATFSRAATARSYHWTYYAELDP